MARVFSVCCFLAVNYNAHSHTNAGSCFLFYEELQQPAKLPRQSTAVGAEMKGPDVIKLYLPKCLCLVSHWPFFSQFSRYIRSVQLLC